VSEITAVSSCTMLTKGSVLFLADNSPWSTFGRSSHPMISINIRSDPEPASIQLREGSSALSSNWRVDIHFVPSSSKGSGPGFTRCNFSLVNLSVLCIFFVNVENFVTAFSLIILSRAEAVVEIMLFLRCMTLKFSINFSSSSDARRNLKASPQPLSFVFPLKKLETLFIAEYRTFSWEVSTANTTLSLWRFSKISSISAFETKTEPKEVLELAMLKSFKLKRRPPALESSSSFV